MKLHPTFLILPLLCLAFGSKAGYQTPPGVTASPQSDIDSSIQQVGHLERAIEIANRHFRVESGALTHLDVWRVERDNGAVIEEGLQLPVTLVLKLGRDGEYTLFGVPWRLNWPNNTNRRRDVVFLFKMHRTNGIWPVGFADFRHGNSPDQTRVFWDEARRRGLDLTVPQMHEILERHP